MITAPRNRVVFFSEGQLWHRGTTSLSPEKTLLPRLIHTSWYKKVATAERRVEHQHNVYHICKVEEGSGTMLFHGRTVPTKVGSLILISPGEPHAFELLPTEKEAYSEATFEVIDETGRPVGLPFHELLSEWTGLSYSPWPVGTVVSPPFQHAVSDMISRIVLACLAPSHRRAFEVNRALTNLLEVVAKRLGDSPSEISDPLEMAANHIDDNLQNPISVRILAQNAGMSTNHFIRMFRERFGVTPLAYHQRNKINAATRLLLHTSYSIKRIAEWTGFSDVYYFSRLFTQTVGVPPGAFRRSCKPQPLTALTDFPPQDSLMTSEHSTRSTMLGSGFAPPSTPVR